MTREFRKVTWLERSNIYEVNIRQYTIEGTFSAFMKHIPRLGEMGVKVLWLMPVTPIGKLSRIGSLGSYYACSSYVSVNPEFGTLDDLKMLVKEAHRCEIKIIIDWVANHTGWDHEWTVDHPDWYKKDDSGNFKDFHGWTDVIDLDYDSKEMRAAMIESMEYWIRECDIDGFRCDMAHLVPLDFWQTARFHCDNLKDLLWLAECETPEYNTVFDITYAWEWMHVTEQIAKQQSTAVQLRGILNKYVEEYPPGAYKLFFTSNHDENSWNGTEYEKYGDGVKTFAVLTCTWPQAIPLIYSGQELPNYKRLKFFEKDQIEWSDDLQLAGFYKSLLELRLAHPALNISSETFFLSTGVDDKVFAYLNVKESDKVLVLLNLSYGERVRCKVSHALMAGQYKNLDSGIQHHLGDTEAFELQPWEHIVYFSV